MNSNNNSTERSEAHPTPSSTIPFARNHEFVHRQKLIDTIHQSCSSPAARTALVGFGGTGKTQLAIEYSYQVRHQSPETRIFWVDASNAARFLQSYHIIAENAQIPARKDFNVDILKLVHDWLRDQRGWKWLLIVDNVNDTRWPVNTRSPRVAVPARQTHDSSTSPLWEYLPLSQYGSVLTTTRSLNLASQLAEERSIIAVGPMEEAEAVELLELKLSTKSDPGDAAELVAMVDFMPLAVIQATAYINDGGPLYSLRKYIEMFQETDRSKIRLLTYDTLHGGRDRHAENSIIDTLQKTFDSIQQERPSAADLLSLTSVLGRQDISESLLRSWKGKENRNMRFPKPIATNNGGDDKKIGSEIAFSDEFEGDILMLQNHFLISIDKDNASFRMLRLVQLATRKWLRDYGQIEIWQQQCIKNLSVELSPEQIYIPSDFSVPMETATSISDDNSHSSMISKQLPAEGSDESGAKILASLQNQISLSSSLSPASLRRSAKDFADILLENDEILQYLKRGCGTTNFDWFEQRFIHLLRNYASQLRAEADTPVQKSTADILHTYRALVTTIIWRRIVGLDEADRQATAFQSKESQSATKTSLEKFLAQQQTDDSQSDDEEPSLPNLEKMANFLVSSTAFKNFKTQLEVLVSAHSRLQQELEDSSSRVLETKEHLIRQRPKHIGFQNWAISVVQRLFRPAIPSGSQRIEWICECGDLLYMDFHSTSIGSIPTMNALLCFQSAILQPSGSSHAPAIYQSDGQRMPVEISLEGNTSQSLAIQSGLQFSDTSQMSLAVVSTTSTAPTPSNAIFLELCVNAGKLLKNLGEINVSSITTDGEFFNTVKEHYLRLRSFRARFWLLKPVSVSYVRFSVEDRCRVGILHKPVALPPRAEVDAKRYHYNPCPLENELPISSDLFLHYLFSCSSPSRYMIWLQRIPRKLGTSILASPAPVSYGWGVHIDEGPDYLKIFLLNLVVLGISGVTAFLWEFYRDDIQGAMGLAAWIVMFLNTLMAVFVTKWSQD